VWFSAAQGYAQPAPGGYRVKGRWPYGSGIYHADWVGAGASVPGQAAAEGRFVILPRDQIVVHDSWQVAGRSGSGSSDYSIQDQFVPEDMSFPLGSLFTGDAVTGGAAFRLGIPAYVASFHIGIALGIARRALDEISTQAVEKSRGFPPPLCRGSRTFSLLSERPRSSSPRRALTGSK
jgi:alkylation response protein AidB-like acyl-CoA dehydrogenase